MNDIFRNVAGTDLHGGQAALYLAGVLNQKLAFYDEDDDGLTVHVAAPDGKLQSFTAPDYDRYAGVDDTHHEEDKSFEDDVLSSGATVAIIRAFDGEFYYADDLADLVVSVFESITPP